MPSTVFDSGIFRDMFGTPQMREVFSDEGFLQACLDLEAALARAQASIGIIPADAAREITGKAHACADGAGGYVHWGATTQDIMDTAVVLQVRNALELIEAELVACIDLLGDLAKEHRDVPMAGRTHLQHALPITFGYKVAIWRDPFVRHLERLRLMRPRVLVGELVYRFI